MQVTDDTWLYHGTTHALHGTALKPSPCMNALGVQGSFVCATDAFLIAACHSLKTPQRVLIGTLKTDDAEWTYFVMRRRDVVLKALGSGISGRVYSVLRSCFQAVGHDTREWVSDKPVAVSPAEAKPIPGLHDLMGMGVQVFFLRDEQYSGPFLKTVHDSMTPMTLVNHPMLTWENDLQNIRPHQP